MYLNSNQILRMNRQDIIWVKESLIKKYFKMDDGVGRAKKRVLCSLLNSTFTIEDECGVIYKECTVYNILFCFGNDLRSGKLDDDFNFMRRELIVCI